MTKTILLSITLLACTAWMAAQSTPSSGSQDSTSGQASGQSSAGQSGSSSASGSSGMNNSGSETTVRGCLSSSGGGYTLTDASGTTYQLQGDTSKLSAHVNNEVEVKGTASGAGAGAGATGSAGSSSSASTGTSASGGAAAGQTFNVTKVKKVSGSCSNSK